MKLQWRLVKTDCCNFVQTPLFICLLHVFFILKSILWRFQVKLLFEIFYLILGISVGSLNLEVAHLRQKLENRDRDLADLSGKHQQALNEHSIMEEQLELMKEKVKVANDQVSALKVCSRLNSYFLLKLIDDSFVWRPNQKPLFVKTNLISKNL